MTDRPEPINCFFCINEPAHALLNSKEMQDVCRTCLNVHKFYITLPDPELDPAVVEEMDEEATTGHLARRGW